MDANDTPSVLVSDTTAFNVPPGTFGLNGIEYHEDGYLIVGKAFGGIIYKVPLNDPTNIQEITLSKSVNSLDGLLLIDGNTLGLVSNNFTGAPFNETVYKIESTDNWATGTIKDEFTALEGSYPTSLSTINDGIFVTFGHFPELVDPTAVAHDNFMLQKVKFAN